MKTVLTKALVCVAVVSLAFSAHSYAQNKADTGKEKGPVTDNTPDKSAPAEKQAPATGKMATKGKSKEGDLKGRLPQYFKQVDLDEKQKQQIYMIQANYNAKIDKLEEETKSMKEKRDSEIHDVLTKDQQKKLDELKEGKSKGKEKEKTAEK